MDAEKQARYQRFLRSGQEPLRLAIALEEFGSAEGEIVDAYRQYLHRRIQPAAAALVDADDTLRLGRLAELGWFDEKLVDGLLRLARENRKCGALVWLLRWKGERYGFKDRDFSL